MAPTQLISNQEDSDLKQFIQLVTRNYKVFIVSVVIAIGLAAIAIRFMTPKYKIASSLLIKQESQRQSGNVNDFLNSSLFGIDRNFQNELWVLKSTPVIEQTIRNLDLTTGYYRKEGLQHFDCYGRAPFRVLMLQNHIQPVNVRFKISIQDDGHFQIKAKAKNADFIDFSSGDIAYTQKRWKYEEYGESGKLIETGDMAFVIQLDTIAEPLYR